MRPTDLPLLATPGRPVATPAGDVYFSVQSPDLDRNAYTGGIHRIRAGGSAEPFTRGERDTAPELSPDGGTLVFLRAAGEEKPQLYAVPTGGGEARRLTHHPLGAGPAVFSADGRRLLYRAAVPEPGRYGTDPGVTPVAEPPRRITTRAYRLDGRGYVGDQPEQAFTLDLTAADAEPVQLTAEPFGVRDQSFGADGGSVLYARDVDDLRVQSEIVSVPADAQLTPAADARVLVRPGGFAGAPVAHGDTLFFQAAAFAEVDYPGRTTGLWSARLGADTVGEAIVLTDPATVDIDTAAGRPVVTADGVLVAVHHRGAVQLRLVPFDAVAATLTDLEALTSAQAVVRAFSATGSDVVASVSDPESAGEVIRLRGGAGGSALTGLSAPLRQAGITAPIELDGRSADGYPVHGWLVLPPGPGPHPVLLNVHGGPHAAHGWGLFDEAQVYAGAGYAVVLSNPRGSAGYGESHGRAIVGRLGTVDAEDVLAILDVALAHQDCDASRVGVMGGSYGGFMSTWLIGHHPDRFAAAISERAVNVWDSFVGSSDIGLSFAAAYVGTGRDKQWAASPLASADRIVTPLLIIHSEQDWRCPLEQGQRLYAALAGRGAPVEMLVFPGEGHELSRSGRPRHRLQRFDAILDWWRRRLPVYADSEHA